MSDEEVATALKTLLTAARPYDLDDVPASALDYTEFGLTRRYGGNPRSTTESGVVGYRITTRAVGKTVSNAREMRKRQHAALEDQRVTVGGETSTPIKFETAEEIQQDGEFYTGLTAWTFAL